MRQTTSFDKVISRLLRKIEKDKDFFSYYNLSVSEVQSLVMEQAVGYLYDAVDLLTSKCEPEVDFYDYDEELQIFNFELNQREIGRMTPSDLNQFSPASERRTFEDMLQRIKNENINKISKYVSTDRNTGKRKTIDHSQYDYE